VEWTQRLVWIRIDGQLPSSKAAQAMIEFPSMQSGACFKHVLVKEATAESGMGKQSLIARAGVDDARA
jgi:hypothetical protein